MAVNLDVIVDVDACFLPFGVFVETAKKPGHTIKLENQ
jgi:hypothetical protein